jgi:hypothetical protein
MERRHLQPDIPISIFLFACEGPNANEPRDAKSCEVIRDPAGDDSSLLALKQDFDEITADLPTSQRASEVLAAGDKMTEPTRNRLKPSWIVCSRLSGGDHAGTSVHKARHAADVMSQYWEEPIDQIEWDARTMRLLVEAICDFAVAPLPFRSLNGDESFLFKCNARLASVQSMAETRKEVPNATSLRVRRPNFC